MRLRRIVLTFLAGCLAAPAFAADDDDRGRDEEVLRGAGVTLTGSDLLDYFRQRNLTEAQRKTIEALIAQTGHQSFRVREKASNDLEQQGLKAISLLKRYVNHSDPEIARRCRLSLERLEKVPSEAVSAAAARMLGRLKPEGTVDMLLAQLPLAEDEYVADAMRWGLAQVALRDGNVEPAVVQALQDELPVRRGAAAEALIRGGAKAEWPKVRELLRDKHHEVRLRTAMALVLYARDKANIPDLIALLSVLPINSGWQAEELLHRIAGDAAPQVSISSDQAARIRARDAWMEWWKKNSASINLADLDKKPRFFGYLMVLQIAQNGGGSVVEYAPDGKTVRWKIDGLQFPISAQVLPSQRVLVAEHNLQQVTERDMRGQVVWRKQVSVPLYCERLENGNTFIVSRNSITETTKDGKEVFTHHRRNNDIVAGARTRDGQVVFGTRTGQVIRIDRQGRAVRSFQAAPLYFYSHLQLLPKNRILVSLVNSVAEYDELTGKQVWSANVTRPSCVQRLPNGNTLVTSYQSRKVVELDRTGKVISEHSPPGGEMPYRAFKR